MSQLSVKSSILKLRFFKGQVYVWGWFQNTGSHTRSKLSPDPQGDTQFFSVYVGSNPASTVHPKKISGISRTPKKYLKF